MIETLTFVCFCTMSLVTVSAVSAVSRSTLLEGNHVFPPLYTCYMLKNIHKPNKVYVGNLPLQGWNNTDLQVGSTPEPPKRLRQHNKELTGGARRTSQNGPWVRIVHAVTRLIHRTWRCSSMVSPVNWLHYR